MQGPLAILATRRRARRRVATPLPLTVWVTDDAKYTSGTQRAAERRPPPVSADVGRSTAVPAR